MEASTNGTTSAGNGVPKSGRVAVGRTTCTVATESARAAATNWRRDSQRGTKPMNRPRTTSTTTISAMRCKRTGGRGGAGFAFMALSRMGGLRPAAPVHETEDDGHKKQRGDGGQNQSADHGA